jgi:hypothetical protein
MNRELVLQRERELHKGPTPSRPFRAELTCGHAVFLAVTRLGYAWCPWHDAMEGIGSVTYEEHDPAEDTNAVRPAGGTPEEPHAD